MNDDLIPGVELSKIPDELKQASVDVNLSFKRHRKAVQQAELWSKELNLSKHALDLAQAQLNELLPRWNPSTQTLEPKLEELKEN